MQNTNLFGPTAYMQIAFQKKRIIKKKNIGKENAKEMTQHNFIKDKIVQIKRD